jgi:hypothetical protein
MPLPYFVRLLEFNGGYLATSSNFEDLVLINFGGAARKLLILLGCRWVN